MNKNTRAFFIALVVALATNFLANAISSYSFDPIRKAHNRLEGIPPKDWGFLRLFEIEVCEDMAAALEQKTGGRWYDYVDTLFLDFNQSQENLEFLTRYQFLKGMLVRKFFIAHPECIVKQPVLQEDKDDSEELAIGSVKKDAQVYKNFIEELVVLEQRALMALGTITWGSSIQSLDSAQATLKEIVVSTYFPEMNVFVQQVLQICGGKQVATSFL